MRDVVKLRKVAATKVRRAHSFVLHMEVGIGVSTRTVASWQGAACSFALHTGGDGDAGTMVAASRPKAIQGSALHMAVDGNVRWKAATS
mmetsp:Transcript_21891/g.26352  ORF Transcript_21891/g.26352 Transcript_21891/m.26352 type:complete len:89 (+) Transcript_21891:387-653(+)